MTSQRAEGDPPKAVLVLLAFAAIYFLWGSTYLAIRYAVETLPPLVMSGTRSLLAGAMLLFAAGRRLRNVRPEHWVSAALAGGLLFLGGHGLLSWAEQRVSSGAAALVLATIPAWMVLLRWLHSRQPSNWRMLSGLALGFIGVAMLSPLGIADGGALPLVPLMALVASSASWAAGSLYARRALLPDHAGLSAGMQLVAGGVWLMVAAGVSGEWGRIEVSEVSQRSVVSLFYLICFGSLVAFSAYNWLIRVVDPALVGSYAFVNPLVAVVLGWLIGGEVIGWATVIATGVIVAGIVLINCAGADTKLSRTHRIVCQAGIDDYQTKPGDISRTFERRSELRVSSRLDKTVSG
ncbi:MAG: EamA family transporter [Candidatus Latescibacteria bacterium]|nr:EamA family transporter [Candidatus Latescibacterota bacterium]NIO57369.1 EamA family transporter [Candidatus Latescibacterota bacterium]